MECIRGIGELPKPSGFKGQWHLQEPLSKHTTWRIGGPADILAEPDDLISLKNLLRDCYSLQIPWLVLGKGSNVLVADAGIRGVVIRLGRDFSLVEVEKKDKLAYFHAGAACPLPRLARMTTEHGWAGLEFAAGIPASLGGAVLMNAGAHQQCLGDYVQQVHLIDNFGQEIVLKRDSLEFGYRHSLLQKMVCVVTAVDLMLQQGEKEALIKSMQEKLQRRRETQPLKWPNAGSVFLNPPDEPAAQIIDRCGLKGLKIGGASVSEQHANFIINLGEATAEDVLNLISVVQSEVKKKTGIQLHTEVRLIGDVQGDCGNGNK